MRKHRPIQIVEKINVGFYARSIARSHRFHYKCYCSSTSFQCTHSRSSSVPSLFQLLFLFFSFDVVSYSAASGYKLSHKSKFMVVNEIYIVHGVPISFSASIRLPFRCVCENLWAFQAMRFHDCVMKILLRISNTFATLVPWGTVKSTIQRVTHESTTNHKKIKGKKKKKKRQRMRRYSDEYTVWCRRCRSQSFRNTMRKKNVAFPESTNVYTFNVIIVGLEKCDHVNEWVS